MNSFHTGNLLNSLQYYNYSLTLSLSKGEQCSSLSCIVALLLMVRTSSP